MAHAHPLSPQHGPQPSPVHLKPNHLGHHILAEFYDCDPNVLNNVKRIEEHMVGGAKACGATVIGSHFHHFSPYGVSGVVIISESHLAIHTWPEYGYAAVDLFTCGTECDPTVAYEYLKEHMNAGSAHYTELSRGFIHPSQGDMMQWPFQIQSEKDDRICSNGVLHTPQTIAESQPTVHISERHAVYNTAKTITEPV